jgi:glycosyl transferase family 1
MKVGVISCGSPDYLIDIVTDGLIRLLGRQSVSLSYNVRGAPGGNYAHLLQGFQGPEPFDIHDAEILIASTRSADPARDWEKRTGKKRPIALLDGEDLDEVYGHLFNHCKVYFKREYIKGRSYPAKVKPLPFAAIPEQLVDGLNRSRKVFYSANPTHPFREVIGGALVECGYEPAANQEKASYNKCLMESQVGVAVRGNGWDTYRFWEIPYFGACLLSQRPGIVIPKDFVDGQEAVYYDTAADFKEKLKALVRNPDKAVQIGKAGHKACMERHLSIHRAKTVLDALVS